MFLAKDTSDIAKVFSDPSLLEAAAKDISDIGTDDLKDSNFKSYLSDALEDLSKKEEEELMKIENAKRRRAAKLAESMHKLKKAEEECKRELWKIKEKEIKAEMQAETQLRK